jgi:hypothetical protein
MDTDGNAMPVSHKTTRADPLCQDLRIRHGQVVVQKAPPGRGGHFGPPRHPSSNRGLADLDPEPHQRVGFAHAADQGVVADLTIHVREVGPVLLALYWGATFVLAEAMAHYN